MADDENEEEESILKEMFDAQIPRVDSVKGPASRLRFLALKAEGPQDPLSIALLKRPPQHPSLVAKAAASTATQNDHPDSDFAYIESGGTKDEGGKTTPRSLRHFPVYDAAHTRNALARAPQSPFGDKAMPAIKSAAKKFGIDVSKSEETPMDALIEAPVAPPGETPVEEPVTKADGDGEDLDASTIQVDPGGGGDPDIPSSQGWENIDSATAQKWTAILGRAKLALEYLSDREGQEVVVTGDGDDADNAWDLQEAEAAVDYAIGVLAAFAVGEAAEAELASTGGVIKAMQTFPIDALEIVEGQGAVKKAGRVLSASNEQAIRDAVTSLQNVLSTLPAAPAEEPAQKSQETPMESVVGEPLVAAYTLARELLGLTAQSRMLPFDQLRARKAKGDPMVAVYTADGNLIGAVDPDDLIEMSPGKPVDDTADDAADGDTAAAPEPTPATVAAPAAPAVAIPVAKSETPAPSDPSKIASLLEAAVVEALKPVQEDHDKVVKSLEERVDFLEHRPREGGPLLSGVPGGGMSPTGDALLATRGQGTTEESEVIQNIRKAMADEPDPLKAIELRRVLAAEKIKELQAPGFHRGR